MIRRRRKPHPKTQPYDKASQYEIAYIDLLKQDGRRRTLTPRKQAGTYIVSRFGLNHWVVKGGFCDHQVLRQPDGRLLCVDHEPTHKRAAGGLCCHEIAVYRLLAWLRIPDLFTADGFRKAA